MEGQYLSTPFFSRSYILILPPTQVTGDGGVALAFGDIENALLESADLTSLYEALGALEEENAGGEDEEGAMLQALTQEEEGGGGGGTAGGSTAAADGGGSTLDLQLPPSLLSGLDLPSPAFHFPVRPSPSGGLSAVPELGDSGGLDGGGGSEATFAPSLAVSPRASVAAFIPAPAAGNDGAEAAPSEKLPQQLKSALGGTSPRRPLPPLLPAATAPPSAMAAHPGSSGGGGLAGEASSASSTGLLDAPWSAPSHARVKFHSPNSSLAPRMSTNLNSSMTVKPSRDLVRNIKADLSKSIRTELKR